jgi:hypothetical protein
VIQVAKDVTISDYKKTVPKLGLMEPSLRKGTGKLEAKNFKNVRGGLGGANFSNVLSRRKK